MITLIKLILSFFLIFKCLFQNNAYSVKMLKLYLGTKFLYYELTDFLLSFFDLIINPGRLTFTQ